MENKRKDSNRKECIADCESVVAGTGRQSSLSDHSGTKKERR